MVKLLFRMILYQSICTKNQSGDNSASHDTVKMGQQLLTRSVVVINLSRYLQTLTLTGYKKLKHYKHLITNIFVTRYLNQPHATLQIPRHTRRPTGIAPWSLPGQSTGWIAPVNVYYHNCRAVSNNCFRADN